MGADNFLQAIDLPAAPALHRPKVKQPDSNEDVDGTHKVPGGKCRFGRFGDAISKWNPILPTHLWSNPLFRAVQGHRHPPSADTCSRSCRRCFARRSWLAWFLVATSVWGLPRLSVVRSRSHAALRTRCSTWVLRSWTAFRRHCC